MDHGILKECIGYNLRISYALAGQLFARVFDDQELAPIQFAALEFISQNPHLSQREIAFHIGTAPTVHRKLLDLTDAEFGAVASDIPPILPRYDMYEKRGDWLNQKWSEMIVG